jgi:hypothetical protein
MLVSAACIDHTLEHGSPCWIVGRSNGRVPNLRLHHKPGERTVLAVPASGAHLTAVHPWLGFYDVPNTRILRAAPPVTSRQSAS